MDTRRKLAALDPDLESPFEPAPSISSNKIARFQGKSSSLTSSTSSNSTGQHQSRAKLEQEEKDRKERLEKEEQEKAYKEFLQDFGGGDDDDDQPRSTGGSGNRRGAGRSTLGVGKGFVRAGGEERYNPLASQPPPPQPPSSKTTTTIPTGPEALMSTMFEKPQPPPPSGPRAMVGSAGGGFGKIGRKNAFNFDDDEDQISSKQQSRSSSKSNPSTATAASTSISSTSQMKKKREGDNFLEQLKREQAAREERLRGRVGIAGSSVTALAAREHAPTLTGQNSRDSIGGSGGGSFDQGDPLTTNVHVGGLPSNVTEESLGKLFARFGAVGSVKIMWPRLETGQIQPLVHPSHPSRKLGGFVAFLRRPDAERAAKEMDGVEWGDSMLRCGWGKAVPVPVRAIYEPERSSSSHHHHHHHRSSRRRSRSPRNRSRSPSPTIDDDPHEFLRSKRLRRNRSYSQGSQSDASTYSSSSSSSSTSRRHRHRRRRGTEGGSGKGGRNWPELERGVEESYLRTVARKVRDHGKAFERVLREREKDNDKFGFLRDESLPSYHYFKMLLEPDYEPPVTAEFHDEGSQEIYSSDSAEDSESERVGKGKLGKLALERFERLLRGLTSHRDKIARGMSFALEHADSAPFIADLLVCSLTIDSTPVPRKLARLHLISDILHNSSASLPNAWVYRQTFEKRLEAVFDHLGDVYLSFPGRMKAEGFKGLVEKVLDVWEKEWLVFEPSVISGYKRRLSGIDSILPEEFDQQQKEQRVQDIQSESHQSIQDSGNSDLDPTTPSFQPSRSNPPESIPSSNGEDQKETPATATTTTGFFKSNFKAASFAPASAVDETNSRSEEGEEGEEGGDVDVDGEQIDVDGVDLDGIDVDGEEMTAEDVDGEEVDVDGAPVEDATMMEEEEDIDGSPVVVVEGKDQEGDDEDIFK